MQTSSRFYLLLFFIVLCSCQKDDQIIITETSDEVDQKRFGDIIITPKEVGGSNYVMYDTQGYRETDTWSSPDNLKLVIGHYHLSPSKVNAQLRAMFKNGQRKIAIVIWYNDFTVDPNIDRHTIQSNSGRLPSQQEQNFKNVLGQIKNIGYNEIIIRFAGQGSSDPGGWNNWQEPQFQKNWNFIYNTINTAETTLGSPSSIKRVYDLGVELGGLTKGQTIPYVDKLWRNFSFRFPNLKSTGFSIAYAPGRLDRLIKTLKATGRTPNEYAIDIYDGVTNGLQRIKNELRSNGESSKTIVIQETYYNDAQNYQILIDAIKNNALNVRYIMQWPLRRNYHRRHFSENYPQHYYNYLPLDITHLGR